MIVRKKPYLDRYEERGYGYEEIYGSGDSKIFKYVEMTVTCCGLASYQTSEVSRNDEKLWFHFILYFNGLSYSGLKKQDF